MKRLFLPYQQRWLADKSRYKIWEKSRRIGATYVQSFEDVLDAADATGMDVWFSSADESAALEYILYCKKWIKICEIAAKPLGEIVLDKDRDLRSLAIDFASGNRINALTSNPTRFNSKGGKVVLDEYAKHKAQDKMWSAAQPVTLHGYPFRILSTYEGKGNRYYRMVQDAKQEKSSWSLHSTTLPQAVDEGLLDVIYKRPTTAEEREVWLREARELAGDEETWRQEYLCDPVDESTAYLTWDLITSAERPNAGMPELYNPRNFCYVGMDLAIRGHLTVIWVLEEIGDVLWTREVVALKNASFDTQERELARIMNYYKVLRLCMDQTGLGEQPIERAKSRYGGICEGILFNSSVKQDLAQGLKRGLEDRRLRNPPRRDIRDSLHSVRRVTTSAGNPRFDASHDPTGHADYFWGLALAVHGALTPRVPVEFEAIGKPSIRSRIIQF